MSRKNQAPFFAAGHSPEHLTVVVHQLRERMNCYSGMTTVAIRATPEVITKLSAGYEKSLTRGKQPKARKRRHVSAVFRDAPDMVVVQRHTSHVGPLLKKLAGKQAKGKILGHAWISC